MVNSQEEVHEVMQALEELAVSYDSKDREIEASHSEKQLLTEELEQLQVGEFFFFSSPRRFPSPFPSPLPFLPSSLSVLSSSLLSSPPSLSLNLQLLSVDRCIPLIIVCTAICGHEISGAEYTQRHHTVADEETARASLHSLS